MWALSKRGPWPSDSLFFVTHGEATFLIDDPTRSFLGLEHLSGHAFLIVRQSLRVSSILMTHRWLEFRQGTYKTLSFNRKNRASLLDRFFGKPGDGGMLSPKTHCEGHRASHPCLLHGTTVWSCIRCVHHQH